MKDKLIGFFGLIISVNFVIAYALFIEGAAGGFDHYISLPSFMIVIAFGGLTYMKKNQYEFNELGKVLKKDLILGGWMGFIIGSILLLASEDLNNWQGGLSAMLLTVLYGYMLGNLIEAFWPRKD